MSFSLQQDILGVKVCLAILQMLHHSTHGKQAPLNLYSLSLISQTSEVQKYQSNPGKIHNPIHALKVRLFNTCESPGTNLGTWNRNMRKTNSF